eukprot:13190872-Alexandrium_andersonii.AAC.1
MSALGLRVSESWSNIGTSAGWLGLTRTRQVRLIERRLGPAEDSHAAWGHGNSPQRSAHRAIHLHAGA